MLLFLRRDRSEGLAKTPRRHLPDARIARHRERFEHDLLHDQASNEVALTYTAQERLAKPLPVFSVNIVRDLHPNPPPLRSEPRSMPLFPLGMLQGVGHFRRIVTD